MKFKVGDIVTIKPIKWGEMKNAKSGTILFPNGEKWSRGMHTSRNNYVGKSFEVLKCIHSETGVIYNNSYILKIDGLQYERWPEFLLESRNDKIEEMLK